MGISALDLRISAGRFRPGAERWHFLVLLHGSVRPLSDVLRLRVPDARVHLRRSDDDSAATAPTVSCLQPACIVCSVPVSGAFTALATVISFTLRIISFYSLILLVG